nr:reverse transcriptase domain-containing protein [Tanacetum cinerariifolium]
HYNQVYPPQEVVKQSRMSRYYPSKEKENITGRRSQGRDLDSGEKFKTSTLGEIVSLEKSNKNVIGLRIFTSNLSMRSYFPPANTIPRHSRRKTTNIVEPEFRTNVTMADNRTMAQILQAPIEGYEDSIVVPQINANNFELKQTLINLVQSNQFTERQEPHNHLRFFNKVTSTFRYLEVPNTTIKMLLFPFSLEGEARIWLDKEPLRSILTWEDLCQNLSINSFHHQRPLIFATKSQIFFKNPTKRLTKHGSSLRTCFDALDSAIGGNFLDKIPRECLSIIESKSKVRYSRSRVTDVRANANAPPPTSSSHSNSFDLQQITASLEDKLDIRMNRFEKSLNDMKNSFITPTAPLEAVEEKKLRLPTLNDTKMVLELADRTISKPMGVAEHVFVKVGKFYFLADFVVLDFVADPRVPLIFGQPFLSTAHAIINVYEREIMIRQNQQSLTIQCSDIPSVKKVEQINKIDFINAGGIDSESKEIEDFLNNDSIPFGVEDSPFNMDEDILFFESLLRDDLIPPHLIIPNQTKSPIEETNHSLNMGYEHFNTNLVTKDVAESSTKNLIPILNECMVVSENGRQSTEPINDNSSDITIISNPLSDVESNFDESTSNHDTKKSDYLDEFYRPFILIHILEEERTRREHAYYINRMEKLFTINPRPHNPTNNNTNDESFSSFSIPNQESEPRQEEINVVSITNDVLPLKSEDSDFDNPLLPLPPLEPPDKEFDFQNEIFVVRNAIVEINARVKFNVFNDENDVFIFIMFAKKFSLLSAESEDTIFDPGISD